LKDRIESQILTHYPKTIETSLAITEQEANIHADQTAKIAMSDLVKRLIEQLSFEARSNEYVDKKSGVSTRLTVAAYENAISGAERRAIIYKEKNTIVWISDLVGVIPAITGKIELVYEGEQEGSYQIAVNLLERAIRSLFVQYFPNPELLKKRKNPDLSLSQKDETNAYKEVVNWFDAGHKLDMMLNITDEAKIKLLYKVNGLHTLVNKYFHRANEKETALLMEFVLHGLASYSLISKKMLEGKIEFKDLMGSMLNIGTGDITEEGFDAEEYN